MKACFKLYRKNLFIQYTAWKQFLHPLHREIATAAGVILYHTTLDRSYARIARNLLITATATQLLTSKYKVTEEKSSLKQVIFVRFTLLTQRNPKASNRP
mgnify:CR=1 FL=1